MIKYLPDTVNKIPICKTLSTKADMIKLVLHMTPPIMTVGLSPMSSDVFVMIGPVNWTKTKHHNTNFLLIVNDDVLFDKGLISLYKKVNK